MSYIYWSDCDRVQALDLWAAVAPSPAAKTSSSRSQRQATMLAQRAFTQQRPVVASRSSRVAPRIMASVKGLVPLVRGCGPIAWGAAPQHML